MRRAIGRLILWFTDPVSSPHWLPWSCSEDATAELARQRAIRTREMLERDKQVFKDV